METWKIINGFEDYMISNNGRIKSLSRSVKWSNGGIRTIKESILKLSKDKDGYLITRLYANRIGKMVRVHRLVAEAFIINSENKPQINHLNGVKNDNRVENLEWSNASENGKHAYNNGLSVAHGLHGINHPRHKLNDNQIIEIRNKYIPWKYGAYKLAKEYNISATQIRGIIDNKYWKHV